MASESDSLIARAWQALLDLRRRVPKLEERVGRVEQMLQQIPSGQGGGGGSIAVAYWIKSPGFSAATGSFPSLTPSTATGVTVYADQSGTMTLYATSQTVRWWFKDAGTANRLVKVERSGDGGAWNAVLDSCTEV